MTVLSTCFIVIKVKPEKKILQNGKGRQSTILQIAISPAKCHEKGPFLFEAKDE